MIIFAYNEQENLPDVLEELNAWLDHHEPRAEIIFVDDGSTDGTLGTARDCLTGRTARFARHDHNRGIGAALKTAVALTRGEWVTFLPADGQIPPAALGILRTHARNNVHHELVFSIYDGRDDGALRTFLSFGVRALIWCVHGVRMRSDGPYLFRRAHFEQEALVSDSFFLNFEFPILSLRRGRDSGTVVVPCRPRLRGRSKSAGLRTILLVARELLRLRWKILRGRSQGG